MRGFPQLINAWFACFCCHVKSPTMLYVVGGDDYVLRTLSAYFTSMM